MNTIDEKLNSIINSKLDIKSAIAEKGVSGISWVFFKNSIPWNWQESLNETLTGNTFTPIQYTTEDDSRVHYSEIEHVYISGSGYYQSISIPYGAYRGKTDFSDNWGEWHSGHI